MGEEREEDKSEMTHGRMSSMGMTPLQSFTVSSPHSRNAPYLNNRMGVDPIRPKNKLSDHFNPLNLEIAPLVMPSGKTKRSTLESERMSMSIMEAPEEAGSVVESTQREKTDFDHDLKIHTRTGTPMKRVKR